MPTNLNVVGEDNANKTGYMDVASYRDYLNNVSTYSTN